MELVNLYLNNSYDMTFKRVKEIWFKEEVKGTPEMAALIEMHNINRYSYNEISKVETNQEFYRYCLSVIIYTIDMQAFDIIYDIFELEKKYSIEKGIIDFM